jgi:branched-chain amino acid transport system substrate-binding protein
MNDRLKSAVALAITAAMASGAFAQEVPLVSLDDRTGATAEVGKELGDAKIEAIKWINARGGVNGKKLAFESVDYAYAAPRAVAAYKRWMSASPKPVTIFGYGTADTEALVGFVNDDKIPYFSHSYSAKLTDPTGRSKRVERPTPYNFFYGAT